MATRGGWRSWWTGEQTGPTEEAKGSLLSEEEAERSLLDVPRLRRIADEHHDRFQNASPFPHAVIDGLFDAAVLERILAEFDTAAPDAIVENADTRVAQKRSLRDTTDRIYLPRFTRFFLQYLNSAPFLGFLSHLTGIPDLIADPYYDGGGLHETLPGGFLDVHSDFNFHGTTFLDRRVNVLIYLNPGWTEEHGGALELWDRDLSECGARIPPVFNRTVVFNTTDHSFHGHPEPVRCPAGESRKSIAMYYFTTGRPEAERSERHSTIWPRHDGES